MSIQGIIYKKYYVLVAFRISTDCSILVAKRKSKLEKNNINADFIKNYKFSLDNLKKSWTSKLVKFMKYIFCKRYTSVFVQYTGACFIHAAGLLTICLYMDNRPPVWNKRSWRGILWKSKFHKVLKVDEYYITYKHCKNLLRNLKVYSS